VEPQNQQQQQQRPEQLQLLNRVGMAGQTCDGSAKEDIAEIICDETIGNGGPSSKRPAPTANDSELDNVTSSKPSKASKIGSAPDYGSKEYWESRYKSHVNAEFDASNEIGGDAISNEAAAPGHEWYFSYNELQPLIMPLILGESDSEVGESEYDEDAETWVEAEGGEEESDDNEEDEREDEEGEWIVEAENENQIETAESVYVGKKGNASIESEHPNATDINNSMETKKEANPNRRPKRVLEVGCGDKPLGTGLILELLSMQVKSLEDAKSIVEEVTCIDYSDTVVRRLIEKEKTEHENSTAPTDDMQYQSTNLRPTFLALDARSLPFQSSTYDLILEKGTLDAMLSDKEKGLSNCIQIVKEMARVTSDGGAILIVSHLNANEEKGMVWLEDVVFNGLKAEFLERSRSKRKEIATTANSLDNGFSSDEHTIIVDDNDKEYVWSIEVHGGNGAHRDTKSAKGNSADDDSNYEDDSLVYGPAVYIIRKKSIPASVALELFGKKRAKKTQAASSKDGDGNDDAELVEMPPVKLSFLSYDGE
jgi:SAM-dependent methyltransferase